MMRAAQHLIVALPREQRCDRCYRSCSIHMLQAPHRLLAVHAAEA